WDEPSSNVSVPVACWFFSVPVPTTESCSASAGTSSSMVCPSPVALSGSPAGTAGTSNARSVPGTVPRSPWTKPFASSCARSKNTPCPSHEPTVVPTSPMHTLSYAASSDPSRRSETLTCDVAVTGSTPSPETVTVTGYTPGAAHVCAACTAYPPNAPATSVPATGSDPSPNVTCASSAATSPPTPVRVANAPVTSRPVTASR